MNNHRPIESFSNGLLHRALIFIFSNRWVFIGLLVSLLVVVPSAGYYCAYKGYDSHAFSRSGSLLVAIAVTAVFVNYYVNEVVIEVRRLKEMGTGLSYEQNNLKELLNPTKLQEEIAFSRYNKAIKMLEIVTPMYVRASSIMVWIEFVAGVAGTLVWGFGDWPFLQAEKH